jgi:hypothetical protein
MVGNVAMFESPAWIAGIVSRVYTLVKQVSGTIQRVPVRVPTPETRALLLCCILLRDAKLAFRAKFPSLPDMVQAVLPEAPLLLEPEIDLDLRSTEDKRWRPFPSAMANQV